jgi:hypothetical protein
MPVRPTPRRGTTTTKPTADGRGPATTQQAPEAHACPQPATAPQAGPLARLIEGAEKLTPATPVSPPHLSKGGHPIKDAIGPLEKLAKK